jgi:hypothetical protein
MSGGTPDDGFPWIGGFRVCYPQERGSAGTRSAVVRAGTHAGQPVSSHDAITWHCDIPGQIRFVCDW